MANLDQLGLPNGSSYNFQDNTQEHSDHRHYDSDLVPLIHKKYESTSYYGTANDWENTSWYFMSVKPDAWYKPWRVKFKVHSYCPNYAAYESYTYATLCGRETSTSYANWNERYSSAHSYLTVYTLKKAGFDAGYGHAVAVSIYNADSRTSSSYFRTFEIDYYECENCTVTILDTPVKWSAWSGTGTTNYNSITSLNAIDRGLQETGDANSSAYIPRPYYTNITAGGNGIKQYSLFARLPDGTYSSFTTGGGTGTKTFDTTTVFDFSRIYYRYSSADLAVGSKCSNDQCWPAYQLNNMQYSFNGVTTSDSTSSLTKQKYLYLVVSHDWKLVSPYYTQDPTASTSVYYILLGFMYDCYRLDFWDDNPIYEYDGTSFKPITIADAQTVNGHTVESDVPSGASFTDTKYTLSADGASVKLTPSSGSATTASLNSLISGLPVGTSDAQGADYLVAQSAGGGSSGTTYYRRPVNKVVNGTVVKAALGTDGSTSTQFLNKKGAWSTIRLSSGTITIDNGSITPLTATSNLKEAYLTWGGKNFSGTYGCLDAAMVPELGANRFMYYTASGITIEYTRDGGTTWQDYGATDAQKVGLFSVGQSFFIGKADSTDKATAHGTDYQLRVTLSTYGILYTQLNKFILYVSTGGSSQPKVTIQKAKGNAPDTFEEVATDIPINGWSGYNVINVDPFTTYGNTIGSQYGYIRFIFTANGGDTNYTGLSVSKILGFGGAGWTTPSDMAKTGHLYGYDVNKNATFPGGMTIKGDVLISKDRKTDSLMFNGYNDAKVGMRLSETGKNMDLGWDWNSYAGSGAYFRSSSHNIAGRFGFYARKSGATVQLIGDTNGSLTWNSKRVVTATDGTQIGGPTTPVYVNSSGYVTACSLSTRNIFVETVTTPYNVGDLWLGSDGTFQCITAKASGEFDIEDWEEIPNGYLDTDEVMTLINQNTQIVTGNGSILWHDGNNDGKYDEILLIRNDSSADPVTLSNATSVYKFYNGGLYYSSTGYNGTYSTILTPDGKGVADFLQYGNLDASKVNITNFNASMITAGLLKRGGTNNNFGEIEVYNDAGVLISKIDKLGFTFYGAGQVGQRPYIKINDTIGIAGYDAADNIVFQVVGDEFRVKKMVVSDEISVGGKLKFLPITIMEGSTVVNDGIAIVGFV